MTIYFTSDLHFNHDVEFIYKSRGFSSMQEHDRAIVDTINEYVNEDDTLYVLGDLMMGDNDIAFEYVEAIKCKNIHIILGNHDTPNRRKYYESLDNVVSIGYADMFKYKKHSFYLSHYPAMTANYGDDDKPMKCRVYNLCGHTHTDDCFENIVNSSYNVGLDAHGCAPISIDDILDRLRMYDQMKRSL